MEGIDFGWLMNSLADPGWSESGAERVPLAHESEEGGAVLGQDQLVQHADCDRLTDLSRSSIREALEVGRDLSGIRRSR